MEAIMRSSITRLIMAVAVVGVIPVGSVVAQSPVEEALPNRYEAPHSETDFRLDDHQQLRGYFLGGSRDRLR
jgi:hypothetical protein